MKAVKLNVLNRSDFFCKRPIGANLPDSFLFRRCRKKNLFLRVESSRFDPFKTGFSAYLAAGNLSIK